jgi:hypothetical protein
MTAPPQIEDRVEPEVNVEGLDSGVDVGFHHLAPDYLPTGGAGSSFSFAKTRLLGRCLIVSLNCFRL